MQKSIQRQGDILIKYLPRKPKNLNPAPTNDPIMAHGEVTGHAHVVQSKGKWKRYVSESEGGIAVLELDGPAELVHNTHDAITLCDDGKQYVELIRQREFDFVQDLARDVRD